MSVIPYIITYANESQAIISGGKKKKAFKKLFLWILGLSW